MTALPLAAALILLLGGCDAGTERQQSPADRSGAAKTAAATADPAFGGRLVSASSGDASNLIPMIAGDSASHAVAGQLYLPLLKYDRNLDLTGQLAESWEVSDDRQAITFHLRRDVTWSDGTPFTAEDCTFTLALMQDEQTRSPYKSDYAKVTRFEAPDPHTFVVHYEEPFSPGLASWASLAILPAHVFRGEDIMNTPLARKPEATIGPYRLAEWRSQQSILLTANRDYFDGPVWIAERLTRVIPDPATQFLELSAGNLDMMTLTPMQYSRLFETKPKLTRDYVRYRYLDFAYTYLGFNLKRPPFDDAKVREAIAFAIDRRELVDGVLLGLGETIATPYKPGTYWVDDSLAPRPFDPAQAAMLLKKAGWVDRDGDGVRERDGRPLSFTILTNNGNKQRAACATIIQHRLKEVGVRVEVRLVEWSAFIEHFINERNFEAVILGWSLSPDPDQYAIWHSSQTAPRQFNFLSYDNPRVDAALEAARRTFDRAERKHHYESLQRELHADVPVVFLYAPYALPAVHARVRGIEPAPAGIGHNSEKWFIPASLQFRRATTALIP